MSEANKGWCLDQAIEITKEYVLGEGSLRPDEVLESTYRKLIELGGEAWKEEK